MSDPPLSNTLPASVPDASGWTRADLMTLTKARLSALVVATTAAGYVLSPTGDFASWGLVHTLIGTTLTAFGAAVFTAGLATDLTAAFAALAFGAARLAAGLATVFAAGLAAALGATALAGLGAAAGFRGAVTLAAALAAAGLTLDFAVGLGLEAAVAGFGDADLDGDLAMDCPTPRLRRARECWHAIVSIRHDTGV